MNEAEPGSTRGRLRMAAGLALVLLAGGVGGAVAHAVLERSEPSAGATVRESPAEVRLWFTQRLEPAFARVQVVDQRGDRVDRADAAVDAGNPSLLRVSLVPVPAGVYRVAWRVVSVDTHVTEGGFTFRVAP